jgi:cytochrome c2
MHSRGSSFLNFFTGTVTLVFVALLSTSAGAQTDAAAIFTKKCSSCHTYGKGDLVGPDLKGVTSRHVRAWLVNWIRSSEGVIRSGDAIAVALFQKYKQQRMPDHDLSQDQIHALLDYLAKDGPETDVDNQVRRASTATPEEVELGKALFYGQVSLVNGGASCASCHSMFKEKVVGSLGPDLTNVYSKYQDKALSSLLQRTCLPRTPSADGKFATTKEFFAVKAFLYITDAKTRQPLNHDR